MSLPSRRTPLRRVQRGRRQATLFVVAAIAVVLGGLMPAAASAAPSITRYASGPIPKSVHCNPNLTPDEMATTASRLTDFCVAFYFDAGAPKGGDDVKSTIADTPKGFLGFADTAPQCTAEQLKLESKTPSTCPANTQIGTGEAIARVDFMGLIINQTIHAKVWNVSHTADEVASFAIELQPELGGLKLPPIKIKARTTLRPNPDVGLQTVIDGQPREAHLGALGTHPIALDGFFLRFWGSKTEHPTMPQGFSFVGSDCSTDQVSRIRGLTYKGIETAAEDRYRLTGCEDAPFGVTTTVESSERRPDVNTSVAVQLTVDQAEDPQVAASMSKTVLTLPAGLELGAQLASGAEGLPLCSAMAFGWDVAERSSCPAGSKVADVHIVSPLQSNAFVGAAYVGEQPAPGELPQLFIEAGFGTAPDAPRVKLRGTMRIDEQGRIESTLEDLPQVLFSTFRLTFRGGDHSVMVTPRTCGTTNGHVDVTPHSTGLVSRQDLALTIDEDCVDPAAFTPSLTVSTNNPQAGGRGITTVDTVRPDRQARITKVVADLPAGVISDLNLATECTVEQAASFACPESSRVGTVRSTSGVGPKPMEVPGNVYLRVRDEGAVAGVVITVPVKFGGVDLGLLNVPARIELRPGDLGLRFTADVPTRYKGLSLNLRSFKVMLDRPGFAINPTNCSPLSNVSSLTSDLGGVASVPSTFQVSGCENLAFDPKLAFTLTGPTTVSAKPALAVKVALPPNGSNIKSTLVTLPNGLAADVNQVKRACSNAAWTAGTCGADAVVGSARATMAITPEVIDGTVSLVRVDGQTLPGIGIQLLGRFSARILGTISVNKATGQLVTNLPSLPDVPLSTFDLTLEGGPRGALIASRGLCTSPVVTMNGSFVGQSGATAERSATTNCAAVPQKAGVALVRVTGSAKKGLVFKITAPAGKKINGLKLALPSTVSVAKAKVGKKKVLRGTKSVKLSGKRTLAVTVGKAGRASITVKVPRGAIVATKKLKKAKTFKVTTRLGYAGGTSDAIVSKVKR